MRLRYSLIVPLLALGLLQGCPQKRYPVKLQAGSSADSLTLRLGSSSPHPLLFAQVATCDRIDNSLVLHRGAIVWQIEGGGAPESLRRLATLRYGTTPPQFVEAVSPHPLGPGCYRARVEAQGAGVLDLWIDSTGSARPWTPEEQDSSATRYSRYVAAVTQGADTAVARCLSRYKAATTQADSTTADAWRPVIEDHNFDSLTCRHFRRLYWSRFQRRPWAQDSTNGA